MRTCIFCYASIEPYRNHEKSVQPRSELVIFRNLNRETGVPRFCRRENRTGTETLKTIKVPKCSVIFFCTILKSKLASSQTTIVIILSRLPRFTFLNTPLVYRLYYACTTDTEHEYCNIVSVPAKCKYCFSVVSFDSAEADTVVRSRDERHVSKGVRVLNPNVLHVGSCNRISMSTQRKGIVKNIVITFGVDVDTVVLVSSLKFHVSLGPTACAMNRRQNRKYISYAVVHSYAYGLYITVQHEQ